MNCRYPPNRFLYAHFIINNRWQISMCAKIFFASFSLQSNILLYQSTDGKIRMKKTLKQIKTPLWWYRCHRTLHHSKRTNKSIFVVKISARHRTRNKWMPYKFMWMMKNCEPEKAVKIINVSCRTADKFIICKWNELYDNFITSYFDHSVWFLWMA